MNRKASICLSVVILAAIVVGPSHGSGFEPTALENLVCSPRGALWLHIAFVPTPWLGCEIIEEQDPVGADLPTVFDNQTELDESLSSDGAGSDRPPQPPLDQSSDTSKTPRSGTTNIGKL